MSSWGELEAEAPDLAAMVGTRRFADLRRDPRLAIHSGSDEPTAWAGDAKLAGCAVEVTDQEVHDLVRAAAGQAPPGPFELVRVDICEAVAIGLVAAGDAIVVSSWRPGADVTSVERS